MKIEPIDPSTIEYNPMPMYPRGTEIELYGDLAIALGYETLKAGDVVEVRALAFVREKCEEVEGEEGIEKELCLQLTDIELSKSKTDRVKQMYSTEE